MKSASKNTFSIGDTSSMTGVSQRQIRNWEARGYIPEAGRVVSGVRAYRRFTLDQVEIIQKIKGYLDEGYTLHTAAAKANASNFQPRKGPKSGSAN